MDKFETIMRQTPEESILRVLDQIIQRKDKINLDKFIGKHLLLWKFLSKKN